MRGAGGERTIPASEFFTGVFQTALGPAEMLVEVRVPKLGSSAGWSYVKMARRAQDWATVGVAAVVERVERLAREGVDRAHEHGRDAAPGDRRGGGDRGRRVRSRTPPALIADGTSPPSDHAASAEFRRHLAGVLGRRALEEAAAR